MFLPVDATAPGPRPIDSRITRNDWDELARFWHPVARTRDLTGEPLPVKLLDVDIVLYRSDDGITAALDRCPHRWIRLSAGTVKDGRIVCPFHGLAFDSAGRCVAVPALGRSAKLPETYRVKTFRTMTRYGMIWVCLDDDSDETIPSFEAIEGHADNSLGFAVWQWPMSAARQIENFIDLAHLPFVHASTLGGDQDAKINPARIEEREKSIFLTARYVETVPFETPTECEFTYNVILPFGIDFSTGPVGQVGFRSVNIASPTSAHECKVFQIIARGRQGEEFEDAEDLVRLEDGPGVINQQDIDILAHLSIPDLPLTEKLEIHLPVDNVSTAYRRRLRALGLGRSDASIEPRLEAAE